MDRGIVTLNDITNGLINVNIMEVQIVNSKNWPSTGAVRALVDSKCKYVQMTMPTTTTHKA